MPKKSQSAVVGAAGEHYVLFQLLRRGWIAAMAPQGVINHDIVMTDLEGNHLRTIQVKTSRGVGSDKGWHMSERHEEIVSPNLFYCFVRIGDKPTYKPEVFIIPSKIVAKTLAYSHKTWLATPGRGGRKRKDTKMRRILPDYSSLISAPKAKAGKCTSGWMDQFYEKWDLLG